MGEEEENQIRKMNKHIMRDFDNLENIDDNILKALLNFS